MQIPSIVNPLVEVASHIWQHLSSSDMAMLCMANKELRDAYHDVKLAVLDKDVFKHTGLLQKRQVMHMLKAIYAIAKHECLKDNSRFDFRISTDDYVFLINIKKGCVRFRRAEYQNRRVKESYVEHGWMDVYTWDVSVPSSFRSRRKHLKSHVYEAYKEYLMGAIWGFTSTKPF